MATYRGCQTQGNRGSCCRGGPVTETGEASVGDLFGDKLYQVRARAALPILVRQATAGETMFYGDLARELSMPNPRNLNYVLGAIGNAMLELGQEWGIKVPPIQALVVNVGTELPGEGISWFAPDAAAFSNASRRQRRLIVEAMLSEVYTFTRWSDVLGRYGLDPVEPPASVLPPVEEILVGVGAGEGEGHRLLKEAIALRPGLLGLPASYAPGTVEVSLYSGDRIDVQFRTSTQRIAVEVKPAGAGLCEIVRGMFQCVKYLAVMEAESKAEQEQLDCSVVLALGGEMPAELTGLRAVLGIELRTRLGTGEG